MRNKLLTRILAGVTAFALVVAGFTTIGTKKVTAAEADGSISFSDSSWWTEQAVDRSSLIGETNPEDIESITFYSDTTFVVGYNTTSGWAQHEPGALEWTCDDIDFSSENYALKLFLSKGDGVAYTINWTLNLKKDDGYNGSISFSDSSWWTEKSVSKAELIGNLDAEAVSSIKFYSDTTFVVGYNTTSDWAQHEPGALEWTCDDIDLRDENYALKLFLSKGDGVVYTINWTVSTGNAESEEPEEDPVVPAPTDPANEDEEEDATNAPVVDDEEEEVVVTETEAETVKKPEKVAVTKVPQIKVVTTTTHIAKDEVITPNIKLDPNKEASKLYQIPLDEYAKKGLTITKVTANFGGDGSVKAFYEANYWFGAGPSIGYSSTNDKGWNQVDQNIEATDAFSYSVNPADIFVAEGSLVQIGLWWAGNPNIAVSLDSVVLSVEGDVTETQEIVTGYKYYLVNEDGSLGDEITEDEYNAIVKKNGEVEADTDVTTGAADMVSVWMILAFAGAAVAATVFGFTFRKREEN